jgi:Protein of unknown function (DUF2478)
MSAAYAARLAAVHYERGFEIDALLLAVCTRLRSSGVRLGGMMQMSSGDRGTCASSVEVVDLRSGEAFNIWEARGVCARGCRLDERGLIDAEPNLLAAIADRVDLLIINRFGRAESLGRGLLDIFTAAIEASVPVLTAVRHPYQHARQQFHGGLAQVLPTDVDDIVQWHHASISDPAAPVLPR